MLFTFPSQYWFAIGLSGVFSLTGWAPLFHARFLVSRATQDATRLRQAVVYGTITVYGSTFQRILLIKCLAISWSYNPTHAVTWVVWAIPRSLATTRGIIIIFFSYRY